MLALEIFIIEAIFVFLLFLFTRKYYSNINQKIRINILTITFLIFLAGIILAVISANHLKEFKKYKTWPKTKGTITIAKVVGNRAFRPDIEYQYEVDGVQYSGTSFLNVPGFGGRTNRLDAAEKIVKQYESKDITIFYNPQNPGESLLKINPPYSVYLQLAFGATLFAVFFYFSLVLIFSASKAKE